MAEISKEASEALDYLMRNTKTGSNVIKNMLGKNGSKILKSLNNPIVKNAGKFGNKLLGFASGVNTIVPAYQLTSNWDKSTDRDKILDALTAVSGGVGLIPHPATRILGGLGSVGLGSITRDYDQNKFKQPDTSTIGQEMPKLRQVPSSKVPQTKQGNYPIKLPPFPITSGMSPIGNIAPADNMTNFINKLTNNSSNSAMTSGQPQFDLIDPRSIPNASSLKYGETGSASPIQQDYSNENNTINQYIKDLEANSQPYIQRLQDMLKQYENTQKNSMMNTIGWSALGKLAGMDNLGNIANEYSKSKTASGLLELENMLRGIKEGNITNKASSTGNLALSKELGLNPLSTLAGKDWLNLYGNVYSNILDYNKNTQNMANQLKVAELSGKFKSPFQVKLEEKQGENLASDINEYNNYTSKMPELITTVKRLSQLAPLATYTTMGNIKNTIAREMGLKTPAGAVAQAEYTSLIDNQILPLLRDTFGAQFTEREGESLRNTLGDVHKSPQEKMAVLTSFINQKQNSIESKYRKIQSAVGNPNSIQNGGTTSSGIKWSIVE